MAVATGVPVGDARASALWLRRRAPRALYLFAHGAFAAEGLAARGIATLRY